MLDRRKLNRYRQLAGLLLKYGRKDFIEAASAELGPEFGDSDVSGDSGRSPEDLARDLADMGPTFVKLAQMLSTRADILSEPYLDALSVLQDDVEGFDFETVEEIVSSELGMGLSKVFERFEETPLAAASLGQVHRATLRGGRQVAVKVQRPGIREQIVQDLDIFDDIAQAVDRHTELGRQFRFAGMVEQFRKALLEELDYRQEANNLAVIGSELEAFDRIVVPEPVLDLTTTRVLTMEFVSGRSIADLGPLARTEIDSRALSTTLCEAYLHQVFVAGSFHSDPHPGNLLLTEDGRIALLDLGMVSHIDPDLRPHLLRLLLALCDGRGRETAELGIELGQRQVDADIPRLVDQVSDVVTRRAHQVGDARKLGRTLLTLASVFGTNGVRPPPEIGLLGKTLLLLDEVVHSLDPDFDPDEVVDGYAHQLMQSEMLQNLNPKQALSRFLDMHGVARTLPRKLSAVIDAVARGELRVHVEAFDETNLLDALEKIGNRIALGLVLAALIVGAALVMQVETDLTLFGYPALAIVLFLAAVVIGFGMVLRIIVSDRRPPGRR